MGQGLAASLGIGAALGLSAGLTPGPLLALVVSQALAHGVREGIKVAFVPILTDLPIILASLFVLSRFSDSRLFLGAVSVAGGLYLLRLAWLDFRARPRGEDAGAAPRSVRKGLAVNLLSPNPYLFWLTVGVPTMLAGWREHPAAGVAFALAFYACLVGTQAAMAATAGRAGGWLGEQTYRWAMRGLGAVLAGFALLLLREGLAHLVALPQ